MARRGPADQGMARSGAAATTGPGRSKGPGGNPTTPSREARSRRNRVSTSSCSASGPPGSRRSASSSLMADSPANARQGAAASRLSGAPGGGATSLQARRASCSRAVSTCRTRPSHRVAAALRPDRSAPRAARCAWRRSAIPGRSAGEAIRGEAGARGGRAAESRPLDLQPHPRTPAMDRVKITAQDARARAPAAARRSAVLPKAAPALTRDPLEHEHPMTWPE